MKNSILVRQIVSNPFLLFTELFLSGEDVEHLHDFEEECIEDYFREKDQRFSTSSDERIRFTAERLVF